MLDDPSASDPTPTGVDVTDSLGTSSPIIVTETCVASHGEYVGCVKWFSNNIGYGFVTVYSEGEMKGRDVFVHHSGVRPLNNNYRTLQKGEYISFDIDESDSGMQAINVTGVFGGPLLCDHRPSFQHDTPPRDADFTTVKGKRRSGGRT